MDLDKQEALLERIKGRFLFVQKTLAEKCQYGGQKMAQRVEVLAFKSKSWVGFLVWNHLCKLYLNFHKYTMAHTLARILFSIPPPTHTLHVNQ